MATRNGTGSVNTVNAVIWSYSTKIAYHTDRAVAGTAARGEVQAVENLGVGVTTSSLFTDLV